MKNNFTLIFTLLLSYFAFSQSANLDREYFKVSYVDLPSKPILDSSKRTYTTNYNSLGISGFSRANDNASIDINYVFHGTEIEEVEIKKIKHEKKDKEGNVTSTSYTYEVRVPYESSATLNVTNNINPDYSYKKTLKEGTNYSSSSFNSYSKAQDYYNNNRHTIRNKQRSAHKSKIISSARGYLNSNYGYVIKNHNDNFWILGKKKHPEFEKHTEAYEKAKVVFDKMKHDQPVAELKEEFKPIIAYFESLIPAYSGSKKKEKKMRYASYFNIAQMYYYTEEFEKAKAYAQKLIDNDYDKSDGKRLIRSSDNVLKELETNKVTTRHMEVKTTTLAPIPEEKPEEPKGSNLTKAYFISKKSDTLVVDILNSNMNSIAYDVKTAKYDGDGNIIGSTIIKAKDSKELLFLDGTHYKNINFKESSIKGGAMDAGNLMSGASEKLCKVLFESDKISLYLFNDKETVIFEKGAKKGKSTLSTGYVFGFKKNLLKLAEGCEALKAKVEKKEFKNTEESLTKFCEELASCK